MSNARKSTAARGWEIFQNHPFKQPDEQTLADINDTLDHEELEPIHLRTVKHYHNMFMAGHTGDYIPINRWDILRSL